MTLANLGLFVVGFWLNFKKSSTHELQTDFPNKTRNLIIHSDGLETANKKLEFFKDIGLAERLVLHNKKAPRKVLS